MKKLKNLVVLAFCASPLTVFAGQWGLGIGTILTNSAYLGQSQDPIILPLVTYQGERFSFEGVSASYMLYNNDVFSLKATLGPGMDYFDPKDADDNRMRQIHKRDFSLLAGFNAELDLGFATTGLSVGQDITGHSEGFSLEWNVKKHWMIGQNLMLQPELGVGYMDASSTDYYYGVAEGESTHFSPYRAESALNPYVGVNLMYQFDPQWRLLSMVRLTKLDSGISDSPIVEDKQSVTAVVALSYQF